MKARHGSHVLALAEDHLGRHHECSCGLFSVPAEVRQTWAGDSPITTPAPTETEVLRRFHAHIRHVRGWIWPTRSAA